MPATTPAVPVVVQLSAGWAGRNYAEDGFVFVICHDLEIWEGTPADEARRTKSPGLTL